MRIFKRSMHRTVAAVAIAAMGLSGATAAAPMTGLIGLYTFESSDASDTSGSNNHGTVGSGVTFTAAGGGVDGGIAGAFTTGAGTTNMISLPIDIRAALLPGITMGAWVRASSTGQGGAGKVLSHDNGGFDRTLGIDFRGSNAGTGYGMFTGSGVLDSPSSLFVLNEWAFIAARYDGTTATLTVNGNHYTAGDNTDLEVGFVNLFIGGNPGFNEDFEGLIDNVFVYSRTLSDSELTDIRTDGFGPTTPPTTDVPAPGTLALLGLGLAALASRRRR